jgi:hypothetical protein
MANPLLHAALTHAARGWRVFPLRAGDKRPAIKDWETRATSDPVRIRRAWLQQPRLNVGIACGPSDLVVIDLDTSDHGSVRPPAWDRPGIRDGVDVLAALAADHDEPLPWETMSTQTPSVIHGRYTRSQPRQGRGPHSGPEFVVAGLSAGRQRRGAVAGGAPSWRSGGSR